MAGWLKIEDDGSRVNLDSPLEYKKPDLGIENDGGEDVTWSFTEFLRAFLEEVYGISCLRPLPPVIGEGQVVDLLKLQIVVRKRGGCCAVSKNGLWGSVAADCGFDSRFSAALKLVYFKYLDTLDRWLRKIETYREEGVDGIDERFLEFSWFLTKLESDPKIEKDDGSEEVKTREVGGVDENMGSEDLNADVQQFEEENGGRDSGNGNGDDQQSGEDSGEDSGSKKRKRECYMGMLNWIRTVAKDPGGPAVEPLPERQKWKSYGNELPWKQILAVREAMLLKRNVDAGSQQSVWQKKQKMHPSMYEDGQSARERVRSSQRLLSSKEPSRKSREELWSSDDEDKQSEADFPTYLSNCKRKRIPIGAYHQADLPEFQGEDYESESKWLGTKIWPLDISEQRKKSLIERERIGKGRQESCGCQFVGSPKCFRFHIREKRVKLKLELGSAFYLWKIDTMGEDVAFHWTKEDQNKFHHIVLSNPLSLEKYFWVELFKNFPQKGREALVSYYFNVFLLQRRSIQNRSSPSNINSDDEDGEYGPIANRFGAESIFCSPKKPNSNSR